MEELDFLLMSVKLLQCAVQKDFEMEILQWQSELWAEAGCERENDDSISSGRFPHTYCQANLSQHFPPFLISNTYTQVHTVHMHTIVYWQYQKHNSPDP